MPDILSIEETKHQTPEDMPQLPEGFAWKIETVSEHFDEFEDNNLCSWLVSIHFHNDLVVNAVQDDMFAPLFATPHHYTVTNDLLLRLANDCINEMLYKREFWLELDIRYHGYLALKNFILDRDDEILSECRDRYHEGLEFQNTYQGDITDVYRLY